MIHRFISYLNTRVLLYQFSENISLKILLIFERYYLVFSFFFLMRCYMAAFMRQKNARIIKLSMHRLHQRKQKIILLYIFKLFACITVIIFYFKIVDFCMNTQINKSACKFTFWFHYLHYDTRVCDKNNDKRVANFLRTTVVSGAFPDDE